MIKRSAILLIILAVGSFSLLVFTSYNTAETTSSENSTPVKCSGRCDKKAAAPVRWNIISPSMFQTES
ncbi:MAG: hypothetical protein IPP72_05075 [Chitinophagaceae bacterium]|nr:hypothetical protein [Chitinophagaceae bacterium]